MVYRFCNHLIIIRTITLILCYTQFAYGLENAPQNPSPPQQGVEEKKSVESKSVPLSPAGQTFKDEDAYIYDPADKRDPFRSLILGKKEKIKLEEEKEEKKIMEEMEKIPSSPLYQFDLSAIKVVAIMWGDIGKYALVEAPDGKGYTIKKGEYIGKSRGLVKDIDREKLLVEEKYKDVDKKIKTRIVELKLKKGE